MQKAKQTVRLGVFGAVVRHRGQNALSMVAHHRKLKQISRIEHHIGIFLIGVNPFLLSGTHTGPLADGLPRRERTFIIVAHDAAQQAVVVGRDDVVVVQSGAGQGGDEDAELARFRNLFRQHGVQGMDTFEQQNRAFLQLQTLSIVLAHTRNEIILRHFDFIALQ